MSSPDREGRCGTCARFVRVVEDIDTSGEVRRHGECLLGVWPAPLYDTSTCNKYVKRGTFTGKPVPTPARRGDGPRRSRGEVQERSSVRPEVSLPEELLDMDTEEFRSVLRQVIQEELAVSPVDIGARWQGGELVLLPGNKETAEKRVPLEAFFRKIVSIRDKLRVLEQKLNGNDKLADDEKVQLQQYITQCYGTLTTFNVLFADKNDAFVGQKSE
jgi:hypothetical protein